jgi:formylglycine-generating enzyme required for sulfatase activity
VDRALDYRKPWRAEAAGGTAVVGSFPAGASRDGVMDLAGNVSEWVSDWYNRYDKDPVTDPYGDEPSNHRSIRGGSWGYYGFGQRASDREFNNPKYPGYIYIGFRVALPKAGYDKVMKTREQDK